MRQLNPRPGTQVIAGAENATHFYIYKLPWGAPQNHIAQNLENATQTHIARNPMLYLQIAQGGTQKLVERIAIYATHLFTNLQIALGGNREAYCQES